MAYPSCEAEPEILLDPQKCNDNLREFYEIYLTAECGYDNGACCKKQFEKSNPLDRSKLGNDICDEYPYNSPGCQVRISFVQIIHTRIPY